MHRGGQTTVTESDDEMLDRAVLMNNWEADKPDLDQIGKDLYARFGANPNAPASEYMTALREAVAARQGALYKVTVRMMTRIADDVDDILKDVYAPKWTQASHFVSSFMEFTTFAFKQ
jgi:hypothetical protein